MSDSPVDVGAVAVVYDGQLEAVGDGSAGGTRVGGRSRTLLRQQLFGVVTSKRGRSRICNLDLRLARQILSILASLVTQ